MILTIALVLIALWVLGFIGNVGGSLIHVLLVLALAAFIYNMMAGRSRV